MPSRLRTPPGHSREVATARQLPGRPGRPCSTTQTASRCTGAIPNTISAKRPDHMASTTLTSRSTPKRSAPSGFPASLGSPAARAGHIAADRDHAQHPLAVINGSLDHRPIIDGRPLARSMFAHRRTPSAGRAGCGSRLYFRSGKDRGLAHRRNMNAQVRVPGACSVDLTHQHTNHHTVLVEGPEITVRPVSTVARASNSNRWGRPDSTSMMRSSPESPRCTEATPLAPST